MDYIDPVIGLIIALILWVAVIVLALLSIYRDRLDNYFARRRHTRREQHRLEKQH